MRLGLERARNALEAVRIISNILEEYGQGGECGYSKSFKYQSWWYEEVRELRGIGRGRVRGVGEFAWRSHNPRNM